MEYERIEKPQSGIVSPSKLRMKLMGPHHSSKKHESSDNSRRTSPSRLCDSEFVKNSLLSGSATDACDEEGGDIDCVKIEKSPKGSGDKANSSAVHPVKTPEDENLDYDSNASSSSFEFHGSDRFLRNPIFRPFSRTTSSKWNDAEKWIMNKHNTQPNCPKKSPLQCQKNAMPSVNNVRVVPETANYYSANPLIDRSATTQRNQREVTCAKSSSEDTAVAPRGSRSVCMRDMGTEMTPVTSQEPSMTTTPTGAISPLRSPGSVPSTPRRGPVPTPMRPTTQNQSETWKEELSEEELKLKTRREIVALGVQLGKMNIAAWASKEEREMKNSYNETDDEKMVLKARAAAWEEAEKSKYTARYKRQQIKIEAWERRQRAKLDTETRRLEARIEHMRAQAQAKMVKKTAMAMQRSADKRAAAEVRMNRDAERAASKAEFIRQTGRNPPSRCVFCGWFTYSGAKN